MENKNANNFWAVSPIITKFGMQSLRRIPKSAVCSKEKSKMAADGIIFLCASGSRPGQTRGPFWTSNTSKRVFWHKVVPIGVQEDKYFSFHP